MRRFLASASLARAARYRAWAGVFSPDAVPERLASALAAVGDFKRLSLFIAAHREAGVTLPALRPIGFPDAPHYLPTVEAASAC